MAEKLEDLNLPNTVVLRIIKEALPSGVNVGKEARAAVAKAASIFILYLTSAANTKARDDNRKTITGKDVIQAMEDIDFDQFVEPLSGFGKFQKKSERKERRCQQEKTTKGRGGKCGNSRG